MRALTFFILMTTTGATLRAQNISTGTIALEDVLSVALRDNPQIAGARRVWEAAAELPAQTGALDDPDITLSHMFDTSKAMGTPPTDKFSISQKLPFPGKRGLKRKAAAAGTEVARQALRAKELEIAARTTQAFYGLYYVERSVGILKEQDDILAGVADVADKKYAAGKAPQAMVFKAQVELARLGEDLLTARQERLSASAALNVLLNRPPEAPLGSPEAPRDPAFTMDTRRLTAAALADRPELLAIKALEGERREERRLALRQYYPDFMLGYTYSAVGSGTSSLSFHGTEGQEAMLGFNVPLWWGRNKAAVKEKTAALEASRASLADMENATRWQVEDLSVKADTAARLFGLYRTTVLPQASAALDSVQAAYQADTAGFLDLLDSERSLLAFELQQEKNRVDFAVYMAELGRVTGAGPDGRKYE